MRHAKDREPRSRSGRRGLARLLAAIRYDLSWRFAPPGAFRQRFEQAIANMLSPEWVTGTAAGSQPTGTAYTPYPWLYTSHLAPVALGCHFDRQVE